MTKPNDPGSSGLPPGFLWGVATSAHQVEGGTDNNQWAAWERLQGRRNGEAFLACDWWNSAENDFDLAQQLGVNALRLSIEWSRLEPEAGRYDDAAIQRYRVMLQGLHQRGIRPFITLHHFTNPLWFEAQGAFLSEESLAIFERFVRFAVTTFGDLCSDWITFNEPNVYVALGYQTGAFPPGRRAQLMDGARVTRNLCLAHAAAYHAIHELQPAAQVGWAQHIAIFAPERPGHPIDRLICHIQDRLFNQNFLDGIAQGRAPFPLDWMWDDIQHVKGTCDFVGVNYYSRFHVAFDRTQSSTLFGRITVPDHLPQGDPGLEHPFGEAYTEGLAWAVERCAELGKPVYILEHGVPDREDRLRPKLLQETEDVLLRLHGQGADLRGYFHWTLTDNYEWNAGWHLRFGLVELDPETQERKLRPSAGVFKELIARHRGPDHLRG